MGLAAKRFWIAATIAGAAHAEVQRLGASRNGTTNEDVCCACNQHMKEQAKSRFGNCWGCTPKPWAIGMCSYHKIYLAEAKEYKDKCFVGEKDDVEQEFDEFINKKNGTLGTETFNKRWGEGIFQVYQHRLRHLEPVDLTEEMVRKEFRTLAGVAFRFKDFADLDGYDVKAHALVRNWKGQTAEEFKERCQQFGDETCGILPDDVREKCQALDEYQFFDVPDDVDVDAAGASSSQDAGATSSETVESGQDTASTEGGSGQDTASNKVTGSNEKELFYDAFEDEVDAKDMTKHVTIDGEIAEEPVFKSNQNVKGEHKKAKGCHLRRLIAAVRRRQRARARTASPKVARGRAPGLMLKLARELKRMFSKS